MAAHGLKALRDITLYSYSETIIDDVEFMLLYDYSQSREIYPYWKFDRFNLESFDDIQCMTEFRVSKNDIERLANVLLIPPKIICSQRTICDDIEGLCTLLKRLSYPCRLTDMVPLFGRNPTELWHHFL